MGGRAADAQEPLTTAPQVLDVGCGEGFAARALLQSLPGLKMVGLDLDPTALTKARVHHSRLREPQATSAAWVRAHAGALPLRDAAFPVVICLEVLEHLPEPWAALEEMRRVCSGYLVLSVPDQPLFSMANFLRGRNWRTLGEDPEHLSHWRGSTFLRLLGKRCEVIRTVRSFPWVVALARAR